MKNYLILIFTLFAVVSLSSNELSWVDTQVEAIKPPRKGMSDSNIANIKSPFIFLNGKTKKKYSRKKTKTRGYYRSKKTVTASSSSSSVILKQPSTPLILSAIINNSALINGEWYKLNENVQSFKVSNINRTTVVLTKGNGKLVLSTSDTKRNLKFK